MDNYLTNNTINIVFKKLLSTIDDTNIINRNDEAKHKKIIKKYMILINSKFENTKKSVELEEAINLTVIKIKKDLLSKYYKTKNNDIDFLFENNTFAQNETLDTSNINDEVTELSKKRGYNDEVDVKKVNKIIKIKYLSKKESIEKIFEYMNQYEVDETSFIKTIKRIYKDGYYMDIDIQTRNDIKRFILGVKTKDRQNILELLNTWI